MHYTANKNICGFSLIELMVAVAIIAILSAVATPIYISYTVKSSISSAMPILDGLKTKVSDYYTTNNTFPTSLSAINITTSYSDRMIKSTSVGSGTPTDFTPSITIPDGSSIIGYVEVTFDSASPVPTQLQNKHLALIAVENTTSSTATTWQCSGDISTAYLPSTCK